MASHRMDRINEEIRKELAKILPTVKDPRVPDFLSVTAVETTADLKECKVFVSALQSENEKEMLKGLQSSARYIRGALARGLRLRYTPELTFLVDSSIKYGMHINELLRDLGLNGNGEKDNHEEE